MMTLKEFTDFSVNFFATAGIVISAGESDWYSQECPAISFAPDRKNYLGVTKSFLENFDKDLLLGILAHELGHLLNGDLEEIKMFESKVRDLNVKWFLSTSFLKRKWIELQGIIVTKKILATRRRQEEEADKYAVSYLKKIGKKDLLYKSLIAIINYYGGIEKFTKYEKAQFKIQGQQYDEMPVRLKKIKKFMEE